MSRSQIKNRNIPRDLVGFGTAEATEFTHALERLYLAVRSETNADWIIDSSKLPAYALRLSSSPNLRIHLIHVVRDSRATAFSWARNKPSSRRKLKNRAPSQAARLWVTHNLLTLVVRRKSSSYMRLRYEDLASEPILSLASITKHLSALVDRTQDEVYPTRSRSISHALMGNPMRHGLKPLDVQLDEEWRDRLRFFRWCPSHVLDLAFVDSVPLSTSLAPVTRHRNCWSRPRNLPSDVNGSSSLRWIRCWVIPTDS